MPGTTKEFANIHQFERDTISTMALRLVPFMMVGQIFCFLDRVNISFASLRMNSDRGGKGR